MMNMSSTDEPQLSDPQKFLKVPKSVQNGNRKTSSSYLGSSADRIRANSAPNSEGKFPIGLENGSREDRYSFTDASSMCSTFVYPPNHVKLSWRTKIFYSLGHVYNDLSVSMWFAYTLLYFSFQFSHSMAGALLLIGQMADAIFSPVVGILSDKLPCNNYLYRVLGKRKTWHLLGVIMTTLSVPFTYNVPFGVTKESPEWQRFLYYSFFVTVFQSGWAATQVAHVTLITDLTPRTNERLTLNAYRQAATVASNVAMYSITLGIIGFGDNDTIKESDLPVFTKVAYIVCVVGIIFSVLFYIGVKEPDFEPNKRMKRAKPSKVSQRRKAFIDQSRGSTNNIALLAMTEIEEVECSPSRSYSDLSQFPSDNQSLGKGSTAGSTLGSTRNLAEKSQDKTFMDWLSSFSFWKITIMYTMSRMFVNVSQVYTPLYLQGSLLLPKRTIAIIPFATYITGFIFSFIAKPISSKFGSRYVLIIGLIFGFLSSVWIFVGGESESYKAWQVYGVSAFIGIGGTAMLIATLAFTSDLIGTNTSTGAFVFAAMSFFDKAVNGGVIELFQQFIPEDSVLKGAYYKTLMIALTGATSAVIVFVFITILKSRYGLKSEKNHETSSSGEKQEGNNNISINISH